MVLVKDVFLQSVTQWLGRTNPSLTPNGGQTYDLMVTCPDALPLKGGFHYRRKRGRKRSRKRSRESAYDLVKIEKSDQSRKLAGS